MQPGAAAGPSDYALAMGPAVGDKVVQLGPEMDEADAVPAGVPVVASVVQVVASVGPVVASVVQVVASVGPVVASVGPGAVPSCPFASRPYPVFHRMSQDSKGQG